MSVDVALLAIAGPPVLPETELVAACRAAAAGGVTAIQVRHKAASASALLRVTQEICRAVSLPVYVNDRADVALAASAAGVHLGPEDVPARIVRYFAPRPFRIGVSVGTPEEARLVHDADVDYWSIGSVYATDTKLDAGQPIGVDGFQKLAALAPPGMPTIAIGGITPKNAAGILSAGASGIAVSRAVFGATDIEGAARALSEIVRSHH